MARAREPWEQREGETDAAYARFREYLGCDPPRPRKMLAERWGISPGSLDVQAHKYEWAARARAWDAESQRRADKALLDDVEQRQRKHLEAARAVLGRGVRAILNGLDPQPAEAARMVMEGIRMERLILGAATERTESRVETVDGGLDLSRLTDDEAAEFGRLLDKAMGCNDDDG